MRFDLCDVLAEEDAEAIAGMDLEKAVGSFQVWYSTYVLLLRPGHQ